MRKKRPRRRQERRSRVTGFERRNAATARFIEPIFSQGVTVRAKLVHFSKPGRWRGAGLLFGDTGHASASCCGKAIELFARLIVEG